MNPSIASGLHFNHFTLHCECQLIPEADEIVRAGITVRSGS